MRVGLLADSHGNIAALEKVWDALRQEACDAHLFLGDICGYYYRQNEVIEILLGLPRCQYLLGNHDELFLRSRTNGELLEEYRTLHGRSLEVFQQVATKESVTFLKSLRREAAIPEAGLIAYHGSPWDPLEEYVYPDSPAEKFASLKSRFVCLGHTHRPMFRKAGGVWIVNPGSCGQPRDMWRPSFAVLDTDSETCEFKRVDYDIRSLLNEIKHHQETNAYLWDILKRI